MSEMDLKGAFAMWISSKFKGGGSNTTIQDKRYFPSLTSFISSINDNKTFDNGQNLLTKGEKIALDTIACYNNIESIIKQSEPIFGNHEEQL